MASLESLTELGQSPWLDNLRRDWLQDGTLSRWVEGGIRGLTSNPSIFQKAISGSELYDQQFSSLLGEGRSVNEAYWAMVTSDIEGALDALMHRPLRAEGLA